MQPETDGQLGRETGLVPPAESPSPREGLGIRAETGVVVETNILRETNWYRHLGEAQRTGWLHSTITIMQIRQFFK